VLHIFDAFPQRFSVDDDDDDDEDDDGDEDGDDDDARGGRRSRARRGSEETSAISRVGGCAQVNSMIRGTMLKISITNY
jgi:hypothetical protein